ncbi:hypothetical protein LDC_1819, partial [sediment metagenome]
MDFGNATGTFSGDFLNFKVAGASKLAVKSWGALSVGTSTPSAQFTVAGVSGTTTPTMLVASSSGLSLLTVTARGTVSVGTSTSGILDSINIPAHSLVVGNGIVCADDGGGNDCATANRNRGWVYGEGSSFSGLDLAELYPTKDETLGAGELVMLDPAHPVFVSRYDAEASEETPALLGVVSTEPGILLGGFKSTPELMD